VIITNQIDPRCLYDISVLQSILFVRLFFCQSVICQHIASCYNVRNASSSYFFNRNDTWSLFKFLQYRKGDEDFTHDREEEHRLYKKALEVLPMIKLERVALILKLSICYCRLKLMGSRTRICSGHQDNYVTY
jgi:hypothetical protein